MNDKLTINYGLRLEHETGMKEKNNQQTVNFDQTAVNPLNSQVNVIDPVTGAKRQILGGLVFAGVERRADGAGQSAGDEDRAARRRGLQLQRQDRAARRLGPLLLAVELSPPPARPAGARSATRRRRNVPQSSSGAPTVTMSNPFPTGLVQPTGNSLGLLTGAGGDIYFVDPNKGAPRVQQYSADLQRELAGGMSVSLGYTGLTGANLGWGGSANALININQLDPKYQSAGRPTTR